MSSPRSDDGGGESSESAIRGADKQCGRIGGSFEAGSLLRKFAAIGRGPDARRVGADAIGCGSGDRSAAPVHDDAWRGEADFFHSDGLGYLRLGSDM